MARQARYALRGELIEPYDGGRRACAAGIEAGALRDAAAIGQAVAAAPVGYLAPRAPQCLRLVLEATDDALSWEYAADTAPRVTAVGSPNSRPGWPGGRRTTRSTAAGRAPMPHCPACSTGRDNRPGVPSGKDTAPMPAQPRTLNLWKAGLSSLPAEFWQREDWEVLILADNALTDVPAALGRLRTLHTLDLGHNALTAVPDEIGELAGLTRYLYLHDNRLTTLPDTLGRLTRLGYLNVGENPLGRLPAAVGELVGLVELRAQRAQLTALPDGLGRLGRLRELWLGGNALAQLPESLGALRELRLLELRDNALPRLPEALRELPLLRRVDLRGNRIEELPSWITRLPALEKLDLRWNAVDDGAEPVRALRASGCVVLT